MRGNVLNYSSAFLRFLSYIKPYWILTLIVCLSLVVETVLDLTVPWVIGVMLVDQVILSRTLELLGVVLAILVGVILAREVFAFSTEYFLELLTQKIAHKLRTDLYDHLQYLPVSFFDQSKIGDLLARISNDVDKVESVVKSIIVDAGSDLVMLMGTIVFLFSLNITLTLVILPTLPLIALTVYLFRKKIKSSSRRIRDEIGVLMARAAEMLSGVRVVKSFAMEKYESKLFATKSLGILGARVNLAILSALYSPTMYLAVSAGIVLVIFLGTPLIIAGTLSLGAFFAYVNLLGKLYRPIKGLSTANFKVQEALAAADRIFEVMNTPKESEALDLMELPPVAGHVRFENVSFAYNDNSYFLKNFSLEVEPGEVVAIVGPSGSGKTTIVSLLLRFYEPRHGRITIDGYPIRQVDPQSLRKQIGIVFQETLLFSGTIRENIAYGNLSASDREIREAAKLANAHDFIMSLPKRYDTEVGEKGVKLSSGEKQRIAIARAVLKNPRIIVLDEATSNVDIESESLIQDALERFVKEKTTFIIGHRLTAISRAHKVVALEQGEAVEVGTHEELLNKGGIYAKLFASQIAQPSLVRRPRTS